MQPHDLNALCPIHTPSPVTPGSEWAIALHLENNFGKTERQMPRNSIFIHVKFNIYIQAFEAARHLSKKFHVHGSEQTLYSPVVFFPGPNI